MPLPARWVKGFGEVQVLTAGMRPLAELSAAPARRFLQSIPRTARRPLWAAPARDSLTLAATPRPGAGCGAACALTGPADGRALIAAGPGAYGIELGTPRERSDRLEEACQVLIGLLSQEETTFSGRYYQLSGARNEPKGPQRPHPPIVIGGSGERRTLRTAARYAQHWNFVGGTAEDFARKRDVLHAHCADAGRDPKEITLSAHVRYEPRDPGATVAQLTALGEQGLDLAIVYLRPPLSPAVLGPLANLLAPLR